MRFHIEEAEDVHADENVIIEADVEGSLQYTIPCVSDVEYGLGESCRVGVQLSGFLGV